MSRRRHAVTGMGAVTPIGIGVSRYWQSLLEGVGGTSYITRFDASRLPVRIAAEVKDFTATDFLPAKLVRNTDLFMHYALVAAQEALAESRLEAEPGRLGIVVGTCFGGISTLTETQAQFCADPDLKISPHFVPKALGNIAAAQIAMAHGLRGPSLTVNTACSSGADAVGLAAMLLQAGEADAVVVVGAESILCPVMVAGLFQARALSVRNEEPGKASRPFDLGRDGFVIGEGAGALVLEDLERAGSRGADIKAELLGYASFTDGYHVTSPDPSGKGEALCMRRALAKAGLEPGSVDYVNAHGTSTKVGDQVETTALKLVFGDHARRMPVSSTKGATGHMVGAGGVTELIACIQAIRKGKVPPTLNYEAPDPECDLDYVPNRPRDWDVQVAMSNSFGFGGQNASVVVGKYRK
ncbi:MAG: beta-ketoacyl-ACP synthase II [Holophaga sp.]